VSEGGLYAFQVVAQEVLEDGSGYGASASSNVTIVITDVDDQVPTFNKDNFTVAVPEDVGETGFTLTKINTRGLGYINKIYQTGSDTPLPDLNIIVSDGDLGKNAEFELVLEDIENSEGVFTVYPARAVGR
jgi:hypothetical protein